MVVAIDRRVDLEPVGIGDGLREARLGQGLALADVEHETCIRAANLEAIESERFDALPGDVYAAGFIRTYADHLGLDGAVCAERFRQSREVEPEPVAPAIGRHRRRQLLAAASALLAAGLVAFVLLRGGDAPGTPAVSKPGPPLAARGPAHDSRDRRRDLGRRPLRRRARPARPPGHAQARPDAALRPRPAALGRYRPTGERERADRDETRPPRPRPPPLRRRLARRAASSRVAGGLATGATSAVTVSSRWSEQGT